MNLCTYLGHVGNGGVCSEAAKVLAIDAFPQPQTKKQVRAFLGLAGYHRKFLPNFATIAAPLTDLTRRSSPTRIPWSPDCQHAFEQLKNSLRSSPILRSPDFSKPFLLQTEASDRGIGAVLSQTDEKGVEHTICFFSKKLLPARKSTPLWKRNASQSKQQSKSSRCTYWVAGLQSKLTTAYWNVCRTRERRTDD